MQQLISFSSDFLTIAPWPDEVLDNLGFDPRCSYVERYWLGVLGPSTTWLLRLLASGFESSPQGFSLELPEAARALGLGERNGKHSPFFRALNRIVQFDIAYLHAPDCLAVRRRLAPLSRRQISRLSPALQESHRAWIQAELEIPAEQRQLRRAEQLALSLLELGENPEAAEQQLLRWRYTPTQVSEAVAWAVNRNSGGTRDLASRSAGPIAAPFIRIGARSGASTA